jgi:hypothetical protein
MGVGTMKNRALSTSLSVVGLLSLVTGQALAETPQKVTACALKTDPKAYDHRLVEVSGFVTHGFEDFSLFDPACLARMDIWLEYGGVAKSGTIYCCGVTADRSRPEPLVVEDVPIPLVEDDAFRRFDERIRRQGNVLVHATLVGRFFAGHKEHGTDGDFWSGYGHMGCCSLLAIQQVRVVDPANRRDVDYDPFPDQPDIEGVGCWSRDLTRLLGMDKWITAQHRAEDEQPWAFDNPHRVASEALAHATGAKAISAAPLKETRRTQGRIVYASTQARNRSTYMVVVSRPYLVTLYARDSDRIAWIALAVYESSCKKRK